MNKDFNNCSEEELLKFISQANESLTKIQKEKDELAERKKNYKIANIPPKYELNKFDFFEHTTRWFREREMQDELDKLIEKSMVRKIIPQRELYPCPECGEMTLRVGDYSCYDGYVKYDYVVMCDNCSFKCPNNSEDNGEAWCEFEDWLKKEGYLK